jgi:hypothetical protein
MKLKPVSMKKALTLLGATDITCNRKAFWHVSGSFILDGKRYVYSSWDIRGLTLPNSDDFDMHAAIPLFYRLADKRNAPNRFDLNERFAALGVFVPHAKHEYEPWISFKRKPKKTT